MIKSALLSPLLLVIPERMILRAENQRSVYKISVYVTLHAIYRVYDIMGFTNVLYINIVIIKQLRMAKVKSDIREYLWDITSKEKHIEKFHEDRERNP